MKPCYLIIVSWAFGRLCSRLGWVHRGRLASLLRVADIKALTKTIVGIIYGGIIAWIALLSLCQFASLRSSTVQGDGKRCDPNEAGI